MLDGHGAKGSANNWIIFEVVQVDCHCSTVAGEGIELAMPSKIASIGSAFARY